MIRFVSQGIVKKTVSLIGLAVLLGLPIAIATVAMEVVAADLMT